MRNLRTWIRNKDNHSGMSLFVLVVIAHGNVQGWLKSIDGQGWNIDDIVGTLSDIETLIGMPKLVFINSCRGGNRVSITEKGHEI